MTCNRFALPILGLGLALSALSTVGCNRQKGDSGTKPAAEAGVVKATTNSESDASVSASRVTFMQEHFKHALALKDALVDGDLEGTRKPALWIAEHPAPADAPDPWIPHITELRQVMATVSQAADVGEVAATLARASLVCGRCHQAAGASPKLAASPEPMADDNEMLIHAWASDQMWEGLVIPSVERWNQGAAAMKDWPLEAFAEHPGGVELAPLAQELQSLAASGFAATDDVTRAQVFGKMLGRCALCHQTIRGSTKKK